MIPIIRDLGYHFVTVDECLGMSAYQNVNSLENKGANGAAPTQTMDKAVPNVTEGNNSTIVIADNKSNLTKSSADSTRTISYVSAVILVFITLLNFF